MANPTLNRPTQPVLSTSLGFGATCKTFAAFGATQGYPLELVSGVVGQAWEGLYGSGVGFRPRNFATGFKLTPDGGSPCIHIGPGSPGLYYVGCAAKSTDGNQRCIRAIVRPSYVHPTGVSGAYFIPVVRVHARDSTAVGGGIGIYDNSGVYTWRYLQGNGQSTGLAVGALAYVPNHWYAIEASTDQSGGSGAYKYKIQIYDITAQSFVGSAEVTNSTSATTLPSSGDPGDLSLGGDSTSAAYPFSGDFACAAYSLEYPATMTSVGDGSPFSNFIIDPWATVRGTYATSGSLTAPANNTQYVYHGAYSSGENGCQISVAAPSGGSTTTPTYTASIERFVASATATASYTPGTGTLLVTGVAMDEGGNVLNYKDTTAVAGTTYAYRVWFTDGTSTVYFPSSSVAPIVARRRANGTPFIFIYTGDSNREGPGISTAASVLSRRLDRPVNWINLAKSGLWSWNWQPGTNGVYTVSVTGAPTSGQFVLAAYLSSSNSSRVGLFVPWNCTAAQLKTILEDNTGAYSYPTPNGLPNSTNNGIGGAGNVTCTGGPLPGTPITVTYNGPTSSSQQFYAGFGTSNNTLNNGATPAATIVLHGYTPDTTYFTPMITQVQGLLAIDPDMVPWIDQAVGENDSTGGSIAANATVPADYVNYHLSAANYYAPLGWKFIFFATGLARVPESVYNTPNVVNYGAAYPAGLSALANGSTSFYGGDATLNYVIQENLGGEDGLHGFSGSNEANLQRIEWGNQAANIVLYGTINPITGGGGGGTRRFGIGFGG